MPTTTTRRLLPKPISGDSPSAMVAVGSLADAMDNYAIDLFGTRANLPAIGAGAGQMSAEDDGTQFYSTDTKEVLRYRHGIGWENLVGHRGKSVIATEESRTNVAYGLLGTADRVQSVILPTDGLLIIGFQGMWKSSVGGAGRAAIFIGASQIKAADPNAAPTVQEATTSATADTYKALSSSMRGLSGGTGATAYTGDVTTGQLLTYDASGSALGGFAVVFAAAGTYDISVQFKATSGSVTAKNRKLWVQTRTF